MLSPGSSCSETHVQGSKIYARPSERPGRMLSTQPDFMGPAMFDVLWTHGPQGADKSLADCNGHPPLFLQSKAKHNFAGSPSWLSDCKLAYCFAETMCNLARWIREKAAQKRAQVMLPATYRSIGPAHLTASVRWLRRKV